VTLNYAENNTATWFSGRDTLNTTPQQTFTTAAYDWRYLAGSVSIDLTDEQKNSGSGRLKDLLRARIENLQLSLRSAINQALFDTTSGDAAKAKQMYGLGDIIQDAATTLQTQEIGGIPKDTVTAGEYWWENQYKLHTGFTNGLGAGDGLSGMDNLYNSCSEGIDHPDIIIMPQTPYEAWKAELFQNQRWLGTDDRLARVGFQNMVFNGAVVMFDKDSTLAADGDGNGLYYMLNTNYIYLVTDPAFEFRPTPFKMSTDQLTRTSQVVVAMNLVCSNMRRQGVGNGLATAA
jgi:hypothetical protein